MSCYSHVELEVGGLADLWWSLRNAHRELRTYRRRIFGVAETHSSSATLWRVPLPGAYVGHVTVSPRIIPWTANRMSRSSAIR